MEITTEKLEENQLLLNIQVEEELVEKALDQAYRRLVQKASIPGFRRGKAPRSMVERFVGHTALMEEALEHLLPELYQRAIEEQGIQPLGQPKLEVVQVDPVIFKAVVPLPPTVELPDYRQIRVPPKDAHVSEERVQSFIEDLRWETAPWEPSLSPAKMGDLLTLDAQAEEAGVSILGKEGVPFAMSTVSKEPAPGLAEHLVGLEKGASKDIHISYPTDYQDNAWSGRHIDFHVNVKEIKEKHLPDLDDEFAKGVGDGFDSLDALRQHVRGRLEEQAHKDAQEQLEEEVVQAIAAGARAEFPPLLVHEEIDAILSVQKRRLEGQGITFAQYLKFINKTEDEVRDDLVPTAKERVKRSLVLGKVAEAEEIQVEPEEVETEIEKTVQELGPKKEEIRAALDTPNGRASIENMLRTRKTLARLVELATAEEPEQQTPSEEATLEQGHQAPAEGAASQGGGESE